MKPKIDTILIIEDDPGLIELINEKIQECGYPTICFQTAASAFEWLENNTPILMVLDYRLPDMNAQEFIGLLKTTIRTIAPFIVATGQGDEKIAVKMMKLGAKDYIIKDRNFLEMLPLLVSKSISEIEKDNKLLITEQKIIELSQFNKQIIANAHEGIIVYDRDYNYLTWNPFMEKITGVLAIDVIGKNAIKLFPFLEKTGEKESIRLSIEERKIIKREFEFDIPNTGKTGWVSQTSGPLFNFEGQVIGAIATVHDLTMRKKAEKALELAKKSYIDIINSVSEAIYILDENATFIDVNEGARKMYQMSSEELIGKSPSDLAAPKLNNLDHVKSLLKTVFETGTPTTFEFWGIRKNGEVFPKEVIVNKGRYFEKDVLVAAARDITERKAAQQEIDKIGKHYQALIENAPDGIVLISAEGQFKYASPSARKLFGYSSTDRLLENPSDNTHPDDLEKVLFTISKILADPASVSTIEYRFVDKTGNWKWVETTFTNSLSDPNVSSIVLNFREITERKNSEDALKQSEEKYRTMTENVSDIVWTSDLAFNITFISSSVEKMLLETAEEHKRRAPNKRFTPDSFNLIINTLNLELENEKNPTIKKDRIHILEVEHCRADGSIFWAEMRVSFLRDETSNVIGLLGVTRDISERKQAELQINKLNNCFLTFGTSPLENINQLVKVCGDLFAESYALYNRLQNGVLHVLAKWNLPLDAQLSENQEGSIYAKIIQDNSDSVQIWRNLKNTKFVETDSNVSFHGLETCISKNIKIEDKSVGSLCVLFQNDYSPTKNEIQLLEIIASAISVEEERLRVQKVLEVSEEKYRTMIEHSNDWIWMLDKEGCFTFINKTAENGTELCAKDWIGKSFIPLVLVEDISMLTNVFQKTMTGEVCSYELRFKKNDATILTILVNTSPIYVQGQITGMISFGQDITERKKAEKSLSDNEALYRNLVQRIPDGVYKSTPEGKFVDINPAMVKILGYDNKEELLKIDIKKELYFDESHRDSKYLNPNNEEKAVFELRKKDGSGIWVEDHGWYNFDENGVKISNEGVLRDITERKKAEEALTEKMDELMRFHKLMVGRELTMIELKKEINGLLKRIGETEKYRIVE